MEVIKVLTYTRVGLFGMVASHMASNPQIYGTKYALLQLLDPLCDFGGIEFGIRWTLGLPHPSFERTLV